MDPPEKYGRAEFVRPVMPPEVVFDAGEGRDTTESFGRAEVVKTQMLPEVVFDMQNPADGTYLPQPPVVLALSAANGHHSAAVAARLGQFLAAVRGYEAAPGPGTAAAVADALRACLDDGAVLSHRPQG